jgi:hypothetical protein
MADPVPGGIKIPIRFPISVSDPWMVQSLWRWIRAGKEGSIAVVDHPQISIRFSRKTKRGNPCPRLPALFPEEFPGHQDCQ